MKAGSKRIPPTSAGLVRWMGTMAWVAVVSVTGCRKAEDKAPEVAIEQVRGEDAAQPRSDDPASTGARDANAGNDARTGLPLPVDFPGDLWVPSSGMIVQASTAEETASLTMTVPALPEQVAKEASAAMTSSGWQQQDQRTNPQGMQQLKFAKGEQSATYSAHLGHDKASSVLSVRQSSAGR
jgi:hypothetical protein